MKVEMNFGSEHGVVVAAEVPCTGTLLYGSAVPEGPVACKAGSCTSPAMPFLPALACVQPSMERERRLVLGRPESYAGAVIQPCDLSKQALGIIPS